MEECRLRSLQSIELDHYFTTANALSVLPRYKVLAVLTTTGAAFFQSLVAETKEIKLVTASPAEADLSRPTNISVLLVAVEAEDDLKFAVSAASEFAYCAQKYVYGIRLEPGSKLHSQAVEIASTISAEYLPSEQFDTGVKLLAQFRLRDSQIIELATDLFLEFDRDQSGLIDLSNIREIGNRLGQGLTDEDLQVIIRDIDADGDGKISLEEFGMWWRSGRKGRSLKLQKLASKITSMAGFLGKYGEQLKVVAGHHTLTKSSWNLSLGNVAEVPTPGLRVKGRLSINKPKAEMSAQLQRFSDIPMMLMATFSLRPGVDTTAIVLNFSDMLKLPGHKTLCSVADNKLVLAFMLKKSKLEEAEMKYENVRKLLAAAPVEQIVDFDLLLGKSPEEIANDLKRSPLEQVLDSVLLKVQTDLWSFYHPLIETLIENASRDVRPLLSMLLNCSVSMHLQLNPLTLLPPSVLQKAGEGMGEFYDEKVRISRDGKFKHKALQMLHEAVVTDSVQVFWRVFDFLLDGSIEAPGLGAMLTQKRPSLD